jgi:hypothetical protein
MDGWKIKAILEQNTCSNRRSEMNCEEFEIVFSFAKVIGGFMEKKRGRPPKVQPNQDDIVNLIPLERAEGILKEFEREADAALVRMNNATGHSEIAQGLLNAGMAFRQLYAFSHELCEASGRNIYRRGFDFTSRLTEVQRRQWAGVKHGASHPVAPLPDEVVEVLREIKSTAQVKPKIFEGEREYQAMLKANGMVESDDSGYESRTRERTGPSVE